MRYIVLALGIATGVTALTLAQVRQGRPGDGPVMALTAMDHIQIKQLVNRYAFALDTASRNGYDYADLFAPDGVFHSNHDDNVPQPPPPINQWALVGQRRGGLDMVGGQYEDVYTKTPLGWRFQSRRLVPSRSGLVPGRTGTLKMARVKPHPSDTVPAVPGGLSAMDYLEIERLVASYGHALDHGYGTTDNGEAYAGLYTGDATFGQSTGHDQLAALGREQPQGPDYARHYLTNHAIEPFGGQAIGKQYLVVIDLPEPAARAKGVPGTIFLGGHYEDFYQRTPEGWRIRTRRLFRSDSGPTPGAGGRPAAPVPTAR